jgi:hypothetical protein
MTSNSITSVLKVSKQQDPISGSTFRPVHERGSIGLRPSASTAIITTVGKDGSTNRHEAFNNLSLRSQNERLAVFNQIEQSMGREVVWVDDLVRAPRLSVHSLDLGLPYLRALAKLYKEVDGDQKKAFYFQQLVACTKGGRQRTQLSAQEVEKACRICVECKGRS